MGTPFRLVGAVLLCSSLAASGLLPDAGAAAASPRGVARPSFGFAPLANGSVAEDTQEFKQLKAMGATQVRVNFDWTAIEPTGFHADQSDYYWTRVDNELAAAKAVGLRVVADMEYGHPLYSTVGGQKNDHDYPPDDPATFARYAGEIAQHVQDKFPGVVSVFEVWNEENLSSKFWKPEADPAGYAALLCASYPALKQAAPDTPVAIGGLFMAPLGNLPNLVVGGETFLDQTLTAIGTNTCFDGVAYHPYPYPFVSPEAVVTGDGDSSANGYAAKLRQVLDKHGYPVSVPLYDTEVGWPTNGQHFPTSNGVTEAMQARYLVRMALLSWQQGVTSIDWYTAYDDSDANTNPDQESAFGVYRYDDSAKPAVAALETFNKVLPAGWTFTRDLSRTLKLPKGKLGVRSGYALEFSGPHNQHVVALWYANENVPANCSTGVSALNCPVLASLPKRASISVRGVLPKGATATSVTTLLGKHQAVKKTLKVSQDPIYVAWRGTLR